MLRLARPGAGTRLRLGGTACSRLCPRSRWRRLDSWDTTEAGTRVSPQSRNWKLVITIRERLEVMRLC